MWQPTKRAPADAAVVALLVTAHVGCDPIRSVGAAVSGSGCDEFRGDISALQLRGMAPEVEQRIKAFLFASSDLQKSTEDLEARLTTSCLRLASALGGADSTTVADAEPGKAAARACGAAAAKVRALIDANPTARVSIEVGEPTCWADIGAAAACYRECGVSRLADDSCAGRVARADDGRALCSGDIRPSGASAACQLTCAGKGLTSTSCDGAPVEVRVDGQTNADTERLVGALKTELPGMVALQLGMGRRIGALGAATAKAGADVKQAINPAMGLKTAVCVATGLEAAVGGSMRIDATVKAGASITAALNVRSAGHASDRAVELAANAPTRGPEPAVVRPSRHPPSPPASAPRAAESPDRPSVPTVVAPPPPRVPDGPPSHSPAGQPAGPAFAAAAPQPASFALVLGVERYRDAPTASGARHDAEAFARLARETLGIPDSQIKVAYDDRVSRIDIDKYLDWLSANVKAGSRVYFYFSGHGAPEPSSGTSYILPWDGDPKYLDRTAFPLQAVLKRLGEMKAREVLAVVDSCFSGAGGRSLLAPGIRPLVRVQEASVTTRVALLTAATGAEVSGGAPGVAGGVFTNFVVQGLATGEADMDGDSQVSLKELLDWVKPRVTRAAKREGREQTPSAIVGSGIGEPGAFVVEWGIGRR